MEEQLLNEGRLPALLLSLDWKMELKLLFSTTAFTSISLFLDGAKEFWSCDKCQKVTKERMVQCDSCSRWLDFPCANLKRVPIGDFYCSNCTVQTFLE